MILTFLKVPVRMELPRGVSNVDSGLGAPPRSTQGGLQTPMAKKELKQHTGKERILKRKNKYRSDMPRRLYSFFANSADSGNIPSFEKFARSIGATLEDIENMRSHKKFDMAYREAGEIRRDYLIDGALTRRYDPSFTKFLLSYEFGMDEKAKEKDDTGIEVTLKVLENDSLEA